MFIYYTDTINHTQKNNYHTCQKMINNTTTMSNNFFLKKQFHKNMIKKSCDRCNNPLVKM